tara:strand:- start:501 stop:1733 length:1233 start_codon:yes stop_codon:yes gene_type:complete
MIESKSFRDKVAYFLNENPDFFNDYPELIAKIKSLYSADLPLEIDSLSATDQITQCVREENQQHIQNKLDWFIDLARNNERIHNHLYEIERMALSSTELLQMTNHLREELVRHFEIQEVIVYLADGSDPFIEKKLKTRFPEAIDGTLRFVERVTLEEWFSDGIQPILRGDVDKDSKVFFTNRLKQIVKSEAMVPIVIRGSLIGCLALGCHTSHHFYSELSSGFISRMAGKIAIAIDNILLMEELKQRSLIDPQTGHYNRFYLTPVLVREFDRTERSGKNISSIMMCIDYLENLSHTGTKPEHSAIVVEVGNILNGGCRAMDVVIRYDETKFFVLLPESSSSEAMEIGERIRKGVETHSFPVSFNGGNLTASLGLASYPSVTVNTHQDLINSAFHSLSKAMAKGGNRAVVN